MAHWQICLLCTLTLIIQTGTLFFPASHARIIRRVNAQESTNLFFFTSWTTASAIARLRTTLPASWASGSLFPKYSWHCWRCPSACSRDVTRLPTQKRLRYNTTRRAVIYKDGGLVWLSRHVALATKLLPQYAVPYRVHETLPEATYYTEPVTTPRDRRNKPVDTVDVIRL